MIYLTELCAQALSYRIKIFILTYEYKTISVNHIRSGAIHALIMDPSELEAPMLDKVCEVITIEPGRTLAALLAPIAAPEQMMIKWAL